MNKTRPATRTRRILFAIALIASLWVLSELARPSPSPAVAPTVDYPFNSGVPVDHFRQMFP